MLTADNYAFHLVGLCTEECSAMAKRKQCFTRNLYVTQVVDHAELAAMTECDDWLQNATVGVNRPVEQVLQDWTAACFTNTALISDPGCASDQSDDGSIEIEIEFSPFVDNADIIAQMVNEGLVDVASPEETIAGTSTTQAISPAAVLEDMSWLSPPEGVLSRESVEAAMALATTTEADAGPPDYRMFNAALKKQAYKLQNNSLSGAFPNPLTMEKYEAELKESDVDISDITASVIKRFSR